MAKPVMGKALLARVRKLIAEGDSARLAALVAEAEAEGDGGGAEAADHAFALARAYRVLDRPEAAEAAYGVCLEHAPDHGNARLQLSELLFVRGDRAAAEALLEAGRTQAGDPVWYDLRLADHRFRAASGPATLAAIDALVSARPDFAPAHELRVRAGLALGAAGRPEPALAAFAAACPGHAALPGLKAELRRASEAPEAASQADAPAELETLRRRANDRRAAGDRDGLRQVLAEVGTLPESAGRLAVEAHLHRLLDAPDRAEAALRGALERDASQQGARAALVQLLQARGALAEARDLLAAGLAADPENWQLRHRRLAMQAAEDPLSPALAALERLRDDAPERPEGHRLLLGRLIAREAFEDAAAALERFAAACPAACNLPAERAALALAAGDPRAAVALYREAGAAAARDPAMVWKYALALRATGETDGIRALYAHVRGFAQTAPELLLAGRLAWQLQDGMAALEHLAAACRLAPRDPAAWLERIRILTRLGRAGEVLRGLEGFPAELEPVPPLALALADAAQAAGRHEEAIARLSDPGAPSRAEHRVRLVQLHRHLGQFEAALAVLESWRPGTAADRAQRCFAFAELDSRQARHAAAESWCNQALDLNPMLTDARKLRAHLRILSGNPKGAQDDMRTIHAQLRKFGAGRWKPRADLTGQLANELLLDPAAAAALAAAARAADPVAATAGVLRAHPRNTVAAMRLLTLLRSRAAGGEETRNGVRNGKRAAIPPAIFQYWEGDGQPPDVSAAAARMLSANPWAAYRLFDARAARAYVTEHGSDTVRRAFRLCRHPAERADLLRLLVLHREGGIYVDIDDLARGDMRGVIGGGARLVLGQEWLGSVGNNFIAAAPGSAILEEVLETAAGALLGGGVETIWLRTGPGALTRALAAAAAAAGPEVALPEGHVILSGGELARYIAVNCPMSYKIDLRSWRQAE